MNAGPHPIGRISIVSASEAAELQGEPSGALIVDVREPREYESLRAPGAVLLPLAEFVARHQDLPRDRQLLLVCRSGSRSLRATMFLMQQGFSNVANVDGGMIAWKNAGLPVHSGPPAPGEGELTAAGS
jgi:rhodanese-related sulfurtransferase